MSILSGKLSINGEAIGRNLNSHQSGLRINGQIPAQNAPAAKLAAIKTEAGQATNKVSGELETGAYESFSPASKFLLDLSLKMNLYLTKGIKGCFSG